MVDVINASTGRSFVSEIFGSEVLTGRYGTGFALGLLAKDVRIALSVAAAAGVDAPAITLTEARWAEALGELGPAADQSKVHQAWWPDNLANDQSPQLLTISLSINRVVGWDSATAEQLTISLTVQRWRRISC
jgi:hypothetical protein